MRDDDPERTTLRQMIATEAENCTDTELLNLVYQLLVHENACKEAE